MQSVMLYYVHAVILISHTVNHIISLTVILFHRQLYYITYSHIILHTVMLYTCKQSYYIIYSYVISQTVILYHMHAVILSHTIILYYMLYSHVISHIVNHIISHAVILCDIQSYYITRIHIISYTVKFGFTI